jgi:hypothetical protein
MNAGRSFIKAATVRFPPGLKSDVVCSPIRFTEQPADPVLETIGEASVLVVLG